MFYLVLMLVVSLLIVHIIIDRKRVKHLDRQLQQIIGFGQTNERLRSNGKNKEINRSVDRMNQLIQQHKKQEHQQLSEVLKLKKEITNISHDLRTPLTSIKGFTELLQEEELTPEKRVEYQALVLNKITTLEETIDLFYQIAQVDSENEAPKYEYISVEELVSEAFLPYYQEFQKSGIQMTIEPVGLEQKIWVDPAMAKRMLTNIIQNVLRYADREFRLFVQAFPDKLVIYAENDTKVAINKEELAQLFDRTYTIDQSRSAGQTGLGLYIVKQLIERQHGAASAEYKTETKRFRLSLTFFKKNSGK